MALNDIKVPKENAQGTFDEVVLSRDDIGAAPATGIDPTAITGTAVVDSDARLSDSRDPNAHAASHAAGGSDPIAPSDIGAQSVFTREGLVLSTSAEVTLTAARAKILNVLNFSGSNVDVVLPQTGNVVGDTFVFSWASGSNQILVRGVSAGSPVISVTSGEQKRVIRSASGWSTVPVDTHTHPASDITSGTLDIARIPTGTGSTQVSLGNHTHGNLTNDGKVGSTSGLPLKTGTAGVVEAGAFGVNAGEFAEGNHTHADLHTRSHAITSTSDHTAGNHKVFYSNGSGEIVELALGNSGEVLTSNGATSAPSFAAASGGDTVSIDASAADVLTATSGAISADDGGTIDSADPFIKWDDTAGKLVYANPLSRPSGAFYVGLAPTTTALGTNAINIQPTRTNATFVAGGTSTVAIGRDARTANNEGVAIGNNTLAGANSVAIGTGAQTFSNPTGAIAIGRSASANAIAYPIAIGGFSNASQESAIAIGAHCDATAIRAVGIGQGADISLRGGFMTIPFGSVYWGGQTTNNTATILTLDASGTASDRLTIAANTALAVDILLVARRSDTADKWLVARRFLGIRRDGSNNTSLIGTVQDYGLDQSAGSPTWTFALTADTTNHALQLEVTGATETVQWRATAFYRVV